MIENSKLFFANLMKKSKISIRSESNKFTYFIANIFHCLVLSDKHLNRLLIWSNHHLDLYFVRSISKFSSFFLVFCIVK